MKTSPNMQRRITEIAAKHGLDLSQTEAHLRLDMSGFDRLVIEKIGHNRVSVAHYFEQNGDAMADPEIVFFVGWAEWVAIEITQVMGGPRTAAWLTEDSTAIQSLHYGLQREIGAFAETWARNIREQSWLERGQRPAAIPDTETVREIMPPIADTAA